jgi:hypothetical protein
LRHSFLLIAVRQMYGLRQTLIVSGVWVDGSDTEETFGAGSASNGTSEVRLMFVECFVEPSALLLWRKKPAKTGERRTERTMREFEKRR